MRRKHEESGVTTVELALVAPLLILVSLAICYLVYQLFLASSMQHALDRGVRWIIVGNSVAGETRAETLRKRIISEGRTYGVDLRKMKFRACPISQASCQTPSLGDPDEVFFVQIDFERSNIPVIGSLSLDAIVFAKNEDYA